MPRACQNQWGKFDVMGFGGVGQCEKVYVTFCAHSREVIFIGVFLDATPQISTTLVNSIISSSLSSSPGHRADIAKTYRLDTRRGAEQLQSCRREAIDIHDDSLHPVTHRVVVHKR